MVIRSKKKAVSDADRVRKYGRLWLWLAFDPISKLAICYLCADQTLNACRAFIADLVRRLDGLPLFTSDELGHYMVALWEAYRTNPNLSWTDLPFEDRAAAVNPDLDYAIVHKVRKNGRVIRVERKTHFGDDARLALRLQGTPSVKINTSFIERFNGLLRQHDGNLHRRCQAFAKQFESFENRLALTLAWYNFVRPHGTLSRPKGCKYTPKTPAQAAELTTAPWTVKELLIQPFISMIV